MSINESEIIAYSWGRVGVPLVFCSGDGKLKEQLKDVPGIEYADQTVTFEAADFQEAYDGIEAFLGVATLGYSRILRRTIGGLEIGAEINRAFRENLSTDWVAVESGQ